MANVKVRSGIVRNAVGAPMTSKPAQLINATTGALVGATSPTDANGRYTFAGLDETVRWTVSVAFGGGSNQVHVNSPISPDLDDAYVNTSLRSAPAAVIAFGGNASVAGTLTVTTLTVNTTANLPAGSITSAHIADGAIMDADISAAAAIAGSKLAAGSVTPAQLNFTPITSANIGSQSVASAATATNALALGGTAPAGYAPVAHSHASVAADTHTHNSGNPSGVNYIQMRTGNYTGNGAANRAITYGSPVPTEICLCIITELSATGTTWITHGTGYGFMAIPAAVPSGDETVNVAGHLGTSGTGLTLNAGGNPGYGANTNGQPYAWRIFFYV